MSAEQLSYVLVTPYSIRKSRTGGILSRLISRTGLDLVRARMFAPSKELAEAYAAMAVTEPDNARHRATQERIRDYILQNIAPNASGNRKRTLLLVFKGPDAVAKVMGAVGHIVNERTSGETIRDTYGDYITTADGKVVYFEPAVLTAPDAASAEKALKLWARYSDSDGGLLENIIPYPAGANVEKTLVLIKPDNFRFPNARPGGVMDVFSRSGLSIIGFKVHHMSVAEAEEFYGPVLAFLQDKFKEPGGKRARLAVERELGIALDDAVEKKLGELIGPEFGRDNWEAIVEFMSGRRPSDTPASERNLPGDRKIVAVIYQGIDAVKKIREVLGPTDPSKAPSGTIRKEFGNSIMVNAAHASDSPESAAREMPIVGIQKNNLRPLIEETYGSLN
ncbi:nucleoside-diphosphate kinase [Verrucomicrobia bacterium SCGC AG-212-E04]|nr:nucleoside-diphosphate kinase [Verrucomicrobia bacterium SCGC AG-212-E04]